MQPALDQRDTSASAPAGEYDFTPSGVYPIARARRLPEAGLSADPFIEALAVRGSVAARIALEELAAADVDWDDDEPTRDFEPEPAAVVRLALPPVELRGSLVHAVQLGAHGEDWDDEAITTRYETPEEVKSKRDGDSIDVAAALAADFRLDGGPASPSVEGADEPPSSSSSPWVRGARVGVVGLEPAAEPEADTPVASPWLRWVFVATATVAVELALLTGIAWALG